MFRFLSFASLATVVTLSLTLLGGGCSSDDNAPQEGPIGRTQAGLTLSTPGFVETTVFQGLNLPTVVRFASDGRVFVAEKGGKIWVFKSLTDATPTLFANLSDRVHDFWDRGLLGMTLDPAFPAKPYVYVLYAYDGDPGGAAPKWGDGCPTPPGATADGCVISSRLSRFTANANVAGAETVLVEGWRQQYPSHSAGQVEFGPDGALYATGGDGASFNFVDYGQDGNPLNPLGDPPVAIGEAQTPPSAEGGALRSQSVRRTDGPAVLNGSMIRVDPTTGLGMSDNPLAASADVNARRIVAYGLRNPFRIAARPGKSELWIADVGWNDWEELNRVPLGGAKPLNFGWPCYEGAAKQAAYDATDLTLCESLYGAGGHTPPYFTYRHSAGVSAADGCGRGSSSVTGIAFYGGGNYPAAYQGSMFFADYSRRCIYVMETGANGDPEPASARSFHVDADGPVFLTTGPGGDLFYAALTSGTIQRISYLQPVASFTANPTQGQVPLIVNFDGTTSSKALPGDVLSYAWDLDGDGDFDDADEAKPAYLYDAIGTYQARLKVTDQRGISGISQPLAIAATADPPPVSTPPEVFIDTPSADLHWKVGDQIHFTGHATDAEDGPLAPAALSWQVVIQHCPDGCHIHDLLSFEGVASGTFSAEDHEYPMHLELILTATDSSGQKRTVRRSLEPTTVSLVFDTEPSGLSLVVGSTAQATPFARRVILGSENSVSAADTQTYAGGGWHFSKWSDGLARSHPLAKVAGAGRYVATYTPGGGLTAQYFDQLAFAGTPLTRIDANVDFDWGDGSPDPSIAADTFSARWTGELKADFAETYAFSTTSDDGVRLTVDGVVVIDHFDNHSPTLDTGSIPLTAGWHSIVLEYFENGGGAQLHLAWSSPSQPEQVIPESHLRPGCAGTTCGADLACDAKGLCTPKCDPNTCKSDQHCSLSEGKCVTLCPSLTCPSGDACTNGYCVDACTLIKCGQNQYCALGKCLDNPPPSGDGGAGGEAGETSGGAASGGTGSSMGGISHGGAGGVGNGGTGGISHGGAGGVGNGGTGVGGNIASDAGAAGASPADAGAAGAMEANAGAGNGSAGQPTTSNGGESNGGEGDGVGGTPSGSAGTEPTPGGSGSTAAAGSVATNAGEGGEPAGNGGSGGSSSSCSCKAAGAPEGQQGPFTLVAAALAFSVARRRRRS